MRKLGPRVWIVEEEQIESNADKSNYINLKLCLFYIFLCETYPSSSCSTNGRVEIRHCDLLGSFNS